MSLSCDICRCIIVLLLSIYVLQELELLLLRSFSAWLLASNHKRMRTSCNYVIFEATINPWKWKSYKLLDRALKLGRKEHTDMYEIQIGGIRLYLARMSHSQICSLVRFKFLSISLSLFTSGPLNI